MRAFPAPSRPCPPVRRSEPRSCRVRTTRCTWFRAPCSPRGTRIHVGTKATLREILLGPARVDDGSQNFAGALRSALGVCGARDIAEFQHVELVIAPSITSEGKALQNAQHVGMGKG